MACQVCVAGSNNSAWVTPNVVAGPRVSSRLAPENAITCPVGSATAVENQRALMSGAVDLDDHLSPAAVSTVLIVEACVAKYIGGVVIDVAVGEQVQAGVQRQAARRDGAVVGPRSRGRVVGLGLPDIGARVGRIVRVQGLEQLRHAAGDEHLAVSQRDEARIPPA